MEADRKIEQGIPIGRYPGITLRNAHLQYIVTWYSYYERKLMEGIPWQLSRRGCVTLYFADQGRRTQSVY